MSLVEPFTSSITFVSLQLKSLLPLMALYSFYRRMSAGVNHVLSMPCTFINKLIGTSSQQWIHNMEINGINIFDFNVIIMPFQEDGHRSLFVVLGAGHIKDYMKCNFRKTRPCILHVLPHETSTRAQMHAYNAASARIRTWLNALWRMNYCKNVYDSCPFTHRSMPTTRPFGMYMNIYVYIFSQQGSRDTYVILLLFSPFSYSANSITKN